MPAAQITIGVETKLDGNSTVGFSFIGDESQLLTLVGGVVQAQKWLTDRISSRIGGGAWAKPDGINPESPTNVHIEPENEYPTEQKLPRDKAIEATEYAVKSLQMRIDAMKGAPSDQSFIIDTSLLQKL